MIPMVDRRSQWEFSWGVTLATTLFWLGSSQSPRAMGVEIYGPYAQSVEVEGWCLGFIGFAMITIYGIHINGRWRWSPILRVIGLLGLSSLFFYLGFSAIFAENGVIIWAFTFAIFLRKSLWFLFLNIKDALARWGSHGRAPA